MFELIAGPCVIESEQSAFDIALRLKQICDKLLIPLVFKASFDKANRTKLDSYRGPGIHEGLMVLQKIKTGLNIRVTSDIHETYQAAPAGEVLDVIQIPAFLCRQTDLLLAAARTQKIVNIKKGQFMTATSMAEAIAKVRSAKNQGSVWVTERGNSFGYDDIIIDFRNFDLLQELDCEPVFDASHGVKRVRHIETLSKAALATGVKKLFLEVHPSPDRALSDGATSYPLNELEGLLTRLKALSHDRPNLKFHDDG